MAESEQGGERTEEPSQRRLDQARERGQVPRSRELTNFATMIGGSAALVAVGAPGGEPPTRSITAASAVSIRLPMPAMTPSKPTMSTKNPNSMVMVNPMPKRFSCGAARVITPRAMFTITKAMTAGNATNRPVSNIRAPQVATDSRKPLSKFAAPMGSD